MSNINGNGRVLIGCETSGEVRRAFAAKGFDAWSCDILPADDRSNKHIQGDIRDILNDGWDLIAVFHPPCTRLCNSGVRWLNEPPTNPPEDCTPEEPERWREWSFIHMATPGPDRWKLRSKTFPEIAHAMAEQWGALLPHPDDMLTA